MFEKSRTSPLLNPTSLKPYLSHTQTHTNKWPLPMAPPYALHIQEMAKSKESKKQECLRNQEPHLFQTLPLTYSNSHK